MEVLEVLRKRKSIRSYKDIPVEEDKLGRVLEAGRIAPSAKNIQDWKFVVVRSKEIRMQLVPACAGQNFVGEAPIVIACCGTNATYRMRSGQNSSPVDVTIAVDHMIAQATEEGLGTCWIGAFYENQVKDVLSIPNEITVIHVLVVGYPKEPLETVPASKKNRKSLDEITCWDKWS